ncbi:MAG: MFS transporter [Turicibacter sp.]
MKQLKQNIKVDYVYRFLSSFDICAGIWVLYLAYKGMSLIEIGLLESIFHLCGLLFEIPTGALADLMGRKKTMIMGRSCMVISCLIMLVANNFWGFALGFIFQALAYNLNSGSEEALVYDSLKQLGEEDRFLGISGKLNLIIEIAQSLSVFIGGILAETHFKLSYMAALIVALGALGIAFRFTEPTVTEVGVHNSFKAHFKTCFQILKQNIKLTGLLLFFPTICTFSTIIYFYAQAYFSDLGYSKIQISILLLLTGVVSACGALCSAKFEAILKHRAWLIIPMCMGISILGFSMFKRIDLVFFGLLNFFTAILWPISSQVINQRVSSEHRATIISISSMFFSLMMIILFPLCGAIGQLFSLRFAFLIMGILNMLLLALVAWGYQKSQH